MTRWELPVWIWIALISGSYTCIRFSRASQTWTARIAASNYAPNPMCSAFRSRVLWYVYVAFLISNFCFQKSLYIRNFWKNTFLNPGGIVHDTLTVYKLKNFRLNSAPPSTMHSWFPGYGWQIINCRECRMHIGWKFTATSDALTPTKFFGLTRNSICHTYEENADVKNGNTNDQADADSLSQISRDLE